MVGAKSNRRTLYYKKRVSDLSQKNKKLTGDVRDLSAKLEEICGYCNKLEHALKETGQTRLYIETVKGTLN